jgi:hypothetical protein
MKSHDIASPSLPAGITLCRFNAVPVVGGPDFRAIPILVTFLQTWVAGRRRPDSSWLQRLGVGLLAMPVALFADVGHTLAHTVSASLAGAPMDGISLI